MVDEKVNPLRVKRRRLRAVEHRLRTTGRASLTPGQLAGWRSLRAMIGRQAETPE
ncbi:MAG: hypothetical protein AAFX76_05590 [Planctomycetota bacterium]